MMLHQQQMVPLLNKEGDKNNKDSELKRETLHRRVSSNSNVCVCVCVEGAQSSDIKLCIIQCVPVKWYYIMQHVSKIVLKILSCFVCKTCDYLNILCVCVYQLTLLITSLSVCHPDGANHNIILDFGERGVMSSLSARLIILENFTASLPCFFYLTLQINIVTEF